MVRREIDFNFQTDTAVDNSTDNLSEESSIAQREVQIQKKFIWGSGIECSFIPHLGVDQFEWTHHHQHWREDFQRAADLGIDALRYALPWHLIEKKRGQFDWAMADERVEFCRSLGINLYMDIMHFGTPTWLKQAAGDPEFPESLEAFSEAIVGRYREVISTWCPCNEPSVLALFSGDLGFWPPHMRGWRGYMPVVSRIAQAVNRSIRAIRRVQPEATVLLCDHAEEFGTHDPELQAEVAMRNLRRFLVLDLLTGKFDRHHPLFEWATKNGLSELDLDWFKSNPQPPDLLGLDYYQNSDWQLERSGSAIRQRHSEQPEGIYGVARTYYQRYGLPMMVTETSIAGKPINRDIWLDWTIDDCQMLRAEGIPLLGYFWWPLIDQIDWDGALTHRVGKIHEVGLFNLRRQSNGDLTRHPTPLVKRFGQIVAGQNERAGELSEIVILTPSEDEEPVRVTSIEQQKIKRPIVAEIAAQAVPINGDSKKNHKTSNRNGKHKSHEPGIVVFSHLRWGFVWQRPQQFLSRFARKNRILFVEEPLFDLAESSEPRVDYHQVMPNVTVMALHCPPSMASDGRLTELLRQSTASAIKAVNRDGDFDHPLLWYYSPMASEWSLGSFSNRGIIYDCMDELSQFTGSPKALLRNEARLMQHADVVFAGGFALGENKRKQHDNVHIFGCAVEYEHFARAAEGETSIPPDIDFMPRPILGWFGVIDERMDMALIEEMTRLRPDWSIAMIGPIVKIDPNLLPHSPHLHWMGARDYQSLPNYCRAFDVCIMPFAMNASTQFINPTKGLEYMATGRPIVSTPVRDVVRQWSDIVRVADTAADFVRAVEDALAAGPMDERILRGIQLATDSSWDSTVDKLRALIHSAVSREDRRSARSIAPINLEDLENAFVPTQGS